MGNKFLYFCHTCKSIYEIDSNIMLCPKCREEEPEGKPLKGVLKVLLPEELYNSKKTGEDFDIFDYLPVEKEFFPPLPVGNTPLIKSANLKKAMGLNNLYLKFDGTNPTGSFKDRASYLVSAFAKKHRLKEIVLASTGNAASSMTGIGASAGQTIYVFMPASAPKAKLVQCYQYGAKLIPINGNYDKAFDLSLKFSECTGFLNRNTAYNPLTIEGKKTVSFELIRQLKNKEIDHVFLPTGDGVILSGVIKGFLDLKFLGLIERIPEIIAVQAEGSAFLFNALYRDKYDLNYKASTIADSISVDVARNVYTAISDLKSVGGKIILVSDDEILEAQKYLSAQSGVFCEPSSAAAFAGLKNYKKQIPKNDNTIVLLTGHGLKDIENASRGSSTNRIFEPDRDEIMNSLNIIPK